MAGNEKFVFDPGNQWLKDGEVAPFFGFPSWWRRFIFQLLSPRDITVYVYLCSTMDNNAVAYPTIEQIADELAVDSKATVQKAIRKLVELGFLVRNERLSRGRKVFVYQRPAVEYTLLKLLKPEATEENPGAAPLIDARLFPIGGRRTKNAPHAGSDSVVRAALGRILQPHYEAYEHMVLTARPSEAAEFLAGLLDDKLKSRRNAAEEKRMNEAARRLLGRDWAKIIDSLPESVRESMRKRVEADTTDAGVPF